jgi:CO dehydrogenase maturation factor
VISGGARVISGSKIGVFGRGGAGKSTFVVLLAKALRAAQYDICVLDADSTNVGLHRAMGAEWIPAPLVDYLGGMVFAGGPVTCPVDDPTPLPENQISIRDLPGRFRVQVEPGLFALAVGKLAHAGTGCDGPLIKIARDVRFRIDGEAAVTLVDLKAGFEDSARGAITGIDWAVVVLDPTRTSIEFAAQMQHMVTTLRNGRPPSTAHLESPELVATANRLYRDASPKRVLFVLNKVRDTSMERHLRDELASRGITPLGVIDDDPKISAAWLNGTAVGTRKTDNAVARIVERLQEEAASAAARD